MGSKWLCYPLDLFNIAPSNLCNCSQTFFSLRLVSVYIVHLYRSIGTVAAWKKLRFSLSIKSDFHMADSLSIVVLGFASRMLMSFSVDETLLPRKTNLSTSFRELPFSVKRLPLWLKHMYSVLSALTWRSMLAAALFWQCTGVFAWVGVFARSAMPSA